ncbi:Exosome component 10 [Exaiptasia diaphana]|nr:Exosome component 10 [Exaiptasia diaphana]
MDEEERNYCCLVLLLSRVGLVKLRQFFINEWDALGGFHPWTDCNQNGTDLLTKYTPLSYEKAKVKSGDTTTWDLSLFVKALLKSKPPFVPKSKTTLVAGLECLKETRNTLCHTGSGKIELTEFTKLYTDACNALLLIGASSVEFNQVKNESHKRATREPQGVLACCNPVPTLVKQYVSEVHMIIQNAKDSLPSTNYDKGELTAAITEQLQPTPSMPLAASRQINEVSMDPSSRHHIAGQEKCTASVKPFEGYTPKGPQVKAAKPVISLFDYPEVLKSTEDTAGLSTNENRPEQPQAKIDEINKNWKQKSNDAAKPSTSKDKSSASESEDEDDQEHTTPLRHQNQQQLQQNQEKILHGLDELKQDQQQGQEDIKQGQSGLQKGLEELKQEQQQGQEDIKQGQSGLQQGLEELKQEQQQGKEVMKQVQSGLEKGLEELKQGQHQGQEEILKGIHNLQKPSTSKASELSSEDVEEYSIKLKEAITKQTDLLPKGPDQSRLKTDDIFTNLTIYHGRKECLQQTAEEDERKTATDDIFARLAINHRTKKRLQQTTPEDHRPRKMATELKQCSDIFVGENEEDDPKSILVSGEPDLEKLKLPENEISYLKSSNLIFCYPVASDSPFPQTTLEYGFSHLTIQEFFVACHLVKRRAMAAQETSDMVHIFTSGLLGLDQENNNDKCMSKVLKSVCKQWVDEWRQRVVLLRCLHEYGQEKEFTRQELTTNRDYRYWGSDGRILLLGVTDTDCDALAMLLESTATSISSPPHRLHTVLSWFTRVKSSPPDTLYIANSQITITMLNRLLSSLHSNSTITGLGLVRCGLNDDHLKCLCKYLHSTRITSLSLYHNNISDVGVDHIVHNIASKLTLLNLQGNPVSVEVSKSSKQFCQDNYPVLSFYI